MSYICADTEFGENAKNAEKTWKFVKRGYERYNNL